MRPAGPLISKITRPRPLGGSVVRPRLVDRLRDADASVWVVSAPAGTGKTTLLVHALRDLDVAWVSVDRADDDPVRFWAHVAAAALTPESFERCIDLLDPHDPQPAIDLIAAELARPGGPSHLVLEDLHELRTPATLDAVGRLMLHPPPGCTIVVTTRTELDLPVARLRARGEAVAVTEADLAFTAAETAELFGDTLARPTVEDLCARTGGWATAIGLVALSAGPGRTTDEIVGGLAGERPTIAEYLAGEVLRTLPDDVRRFLVVTSIVGHALSPELCDRLTGRTDSLAVLRELTRKLLFTQQLDTPVDDPGAATYRYHPILCDVLGDDFAELPADERRRLHLEAAAWFDDHLDPGSAVDHALAAGDDALTLALIKRSFGHCSRVGLLQTVLDWLTRYGLDRCRHDPELRLMAAWALLNARRYDELDEWLHPPDDADPDPPSLAWQGPTIASHRARHLGDLPAALAFADDALRLAPHTDTVGALDVGAVARLLDGRGDRATSSRVADLGRAAQVDQAVISGLMCVALLDTDADPPDLDAARRHAEDALGRVVGAAAERFHQPHLAWLALARAARAEARLADAVDAAARARRIAEAGHEPLVEILVACEQAEIAHRLGEAAEARAHLRRAEERCSPDAGDHLAAVVRRTRAAIRFANPADGLVVPLSERELVVLRCLPAGLGRRELAAQLHVSENTLKTQLTSIRRKLGVEPGGDVVERAVALGLLDG